VRAWGRLCVCGVPTRCPCRPCHATKRQSQIATVTAVQARLSRPAVRVEVTWHEEREGTFVPVVLECCSRWSSLSAAAVDRGTHRAHGRRQAVQAAGRVRAGHFELSVRLQKCGGRATKRVLSRWSVGVNGCLPRSSRAPPAPSQLFSPSLHSQVVTSK
jgi:hypothetical protein